MSAAAVPPVAVRAEESRAARRLVRVLALIAHLLCVWIVAMVAFPFLSPEVRERFLVRKARRMLGILAVRVEVRGEEFNTQGPALLVANHISWLDVYILGALFAVRFIAKSDVASYPIVGTIARRSGAIFIVRGRIFSAMRARMAATAALRDRSVGLFPEGTTTDGTRIRYFYPALFQSAIDAGAPVVPVSLRYFDDRGSPTTAPAFADDTTFLQSLRAILRMKSIRAELNFCEAIPPASASRKELALEANHAIASALGLPPATRRPRELPGSSPVVRGPSDPMSAARPVLAGA